MSNFEQKYDIEKLILKSKFIQALIDILPNFILAEIYKMPSKLAKFRF